MIWNGSYEQDLQHRTCCAAVLRVYRCTLNTVHCLKIAWRAHIVFMVQSPAGMPVDPSARSNSFINPQALDQCTIWTRSRWPLAYYNMIQISRCTAAHRHTVWHSWHGHGEGEQPRLLFGVTDCLHALVTGETSKAMNVQCHGLQGV